MPDLDARFRGLDRLAAPDLWPDIERREPRPAPDGPTTPRWLVAAVAILLAAAGIAVAVRAFVTDRAPRRPAQPIPSPAAPVHPVVDVTVPIRWPSSIVYGEGSIWVAASANDGTPRGTIYRIDPDTAEVLAEIPSPVVPGWETGGGAMEVADGSVWVAGGGASSNLVRIDAATNQVVQEIDVQGRFLGDVTVDEHGVWVSMFVKDGEDQGIDLVLLDPVTGAEETRIPVGSSYAREVLAVDGTIWVHARETHGPVVGDSVLMRIDPGTGRVTQSVPIGGSLTSVAEGDGVIWGTTWRSKDGNLLVLVDPQTGDVQEIPAGSLDYLVEVGEGGLWGRGLDQATGRLGVVRFDPATGQVDASVSLERDQNPIALAVARGSVWIVTYNHGVVRIELRPD